MNDEWMKDGSCHNKPELTDTFFPAPEEVLTVLPAARAICADCPVREACLEYALANTHGVWGGTSERERRKIRRQRRLAARKETAA